MAKFLIVYDEVGIVRVERIENNAFTDALKAKKVIDIARIGFAEVNPFELIPAIHINDAAVISIINSDRLTTPEKERYLNLLRPGLPLKDSYEAVIIEGEGDRWFPMMRGEAPIPPAHTRLVITYIDP